MLCCLGAGRVRLLRTRQVACSRRHRRRAGPAMQTAAAGALNSAGLCPAAMAPVACDGASRRVQQTPG